MLFTIIFFIYIVFFFIAASDWRRGVSLWCAWKLVFANNQVYLKYSYPSLSLSFVVTITLFLFFCLSRVSNKKNIIIRGFPYAKICVVTVFVNLVSSYFSILPDKHMGGMLTGMIDTYVLLYLFYAAIQEKKYFDIFTKHIIIVGCIISLYGLIESITARNMINEYIWNSVPIQYISERTYDVSAAHENLRFGFTSCYSFFHIHIIFGVTCVLISFFFIQIRSEFKPILFYFLLAVILSGAFISTSKTAMIGTLCLFPYLINKKTILKPVSVVVSLVLIIVVFILFLPIIQGGLSDTAVESNGGGSSIQLRLSQIGYNYALFFDSPIYGHGPSSFSYILQNIDPDIGYESVYMSIPVETGLLGFFSYFYMYGQLFHFGVKNMGKRLILGFIFIVMIMESITGFFGETTIGIIYLATLRLCQIKKKRSSLIRSNFL